MVVVDKNTSEADDVPNWDSSEQSSLTGYGCWSSTLGLAPFRNAATNVNLKLSGSACLKGGFSECEKPEIL